MIKKELGNYQPAWQQQTQQFKMFSTFQNKFTITMRFLWNCKWDGESKIQQSGTWKCSCNFKKAMWSFRNCGRVASDSCRTAFSASSSSTLWISSFNACPTHRQHKDQFLSQITLQASVSLLPLIDYLCGVWEISLKKINLHQWMSPASDSKLHEWTLLLGTLLLSRLSFPHPTTWLPFSSGLQLETV